ncbi:4Fe-4S binding protein, partial [bacterium]|nr:4Fe-4S binding protein [bacterium]
IIDIARKALDAGEIGGVILLKKTAPDSAMHSLVSSSDMLTDADPLMPFFPGNAANFIKKLTKIAPPDKKILAILRPCEMRATIEMVKLAQIQNENIIYLTFDCAGTIPRKELKDGEIPSGDEFYQNDNFEKIREVCQVCDFVRVDTGDIGFLAFEDGAPIVAYTDAGREFLKNVGVEFVEDVVADKYEPIAQRHSERKSEIFARLDEQTAGLDNLMGTFSHCINCHNCMTNCPICICRECFFESEALDFEGDAFVELALRKGALRAPTDVLLFHIGRMTHMTTSCVGCGACGEACPEDIPVDLIFRWVAENVQKKFDYVAGRNWDEELPLKTFREDELEPR